MAYRVTTDESGFVVSVERVQLSQNASSTKKQSGVTTSKPNVQYQKAESKQKRPLKAKKPKSKAQNTVLRTLAKPSTPKKLKAQNLLPMQQLAKKPLVRCSECNVNVREDRWNKHVLKHETKISRKAPVTKKQVVSKGRAKSARSQTLTGEQRQAVRGLHEELLYGDKYVGISRRDFDGSFGSISLYDNYGEESHP